MPASGSRRFWIGAACALAVLLIWASFILIARASATRSLLPLDIAFLRLLFAGVVVLPLLAWRRARGRPILGALPLGQVAGLAAVAGVGYCSFAYAGFFYAPVAHAAVLLPGSLPLWTALIAIALLGERLSRSRAAGLVCIVGGDLLVGGQSLLAAFDGGDTWKGDVLFLAASATWGLYTVLCRRWRVGALDATLAIAVGSLASFVPLYALGAALDLWPTRLGAAPSGELLFQGVYQGAIAMLLSGIAFTQVVNTFGPMRTTMITALVPVLAALAAVPLLGEPLGPLPFAGLGAVTLGMWLGLRMRAARAPRDDPIIVPSQGGAQWHRSTK